MKTLQWFLKSWICVLTMTQAGLVVGSENEMLALRHSDERISIRQHGMRHAELPILGKTPSLVEGRVELSRFFRKIAGKPEIHTEASSAFCGFLRNEKRA